MWQIIWNWTLVSSLLSKSHNLFFFLLLFYFEEIGEGLFGIAGDLAGAFHELYIEDKGESAERLSLYRRFQFRNLYSMAVKLEYHTGDRWCRNATSELAEKIKTQYPLLSSENIRIP